MKRSHQITRLVAVGFSKPELDKMTNDLLVTTFIAAKPLMQARAAEIEQIRHREEAARKRHEEQERQRKLEIDWRRNYRIPPICTVRLVNVDAKTIMSMIEQATAKLERLKVEFRKTGAKEIRDALTGVPHYIAGLQQELNLLS